MSRRQEFFYGVRSILPLLLGVLPLGLVAGVTGVSIGFSPCESLMASSIIFAGAAQIAAYQLLALQSPLIVVWFAVFMINLRHIMYSASIAPHFKGVTMPLRMLAAYVMTDQAYIFGLQRFNQAEAQTSAHKIYFYWGVSLFIWLMWVLAAASGAYLGAAIPTSWGLDFIVPLMFMALVIPNINNIPSFGAALSAALIALLTYNLPFRLGLIVASLCGMGIGVLLERWERQQ
ncbi:MAG: AzlC family ABC transporter permease [Deinococcales bacterium]